MRQIIRLRLDAEKVSLPIPLRGFLRTDGLTVTWRAMQWMTSARFTSAYEPVLLFRLRDENLSGACVKWERCAVVGAED